MEGPNVMALLGGKPKLPRYLGGCESQDGRKAVVGCLLLGRYGARYLIMCFMDGLKINLDIISPALTHQPLLSPMFSSGTALLNTHHHVVCFLDELFTRGFKYGTCMSSCYIALVLTLAGCSRRQETGQAEDIQTGMSNTPPGQSRCAPHTCPARNRWLNVLSEPSCIFAASF